MKLKKRLTIVLAMSIMSASITATTTMGQSNKLDVKENGSKTTLDNTNDDKEETILIASFEDGIPDFVSTVDSNIEIVTEGATDGEKALKVSFNKADYPNVKFTAEDTWNWGKNKAVSFDVYNPTDKLATLYTQTDVIDSVTGENKSTVNTIVVKPGEKAKMYVSYSKDSLDLGMRGLPPNPAGSPLGYGWGETDPDLTQVKAFQFWLYNPSEAVDLIFDNICVVPDPNTDLSYINDTVDEYGQYTGLDWEGKIKSDEDLRAHREAEEEAYASGRPDYMSKYGGWAEGPQLEATGRFRVDKHDDKWTLVDPDGNLFFATGVACVRFGDASTWIDGRREMFSNLPDKNGELSEHFGYTGNVARPPLGLPEGETFNFYTANLERKYGDDYINEWRDMTVARFKSWGFSTIGNWSEPELFFGKGEELETTYAANAWINGSHAKLKSGNEFAPEIADPFDPQFRKDARTAFKEVATYGVDDDKWCMGIYVDNEIAWGNPGEDITHYGSIINTLAEDASTHDRYAKREFVEILKDKYSNDISALNSKWEVNISSWEELEAPYKIENITPGIKEDLSLLLSKTAEEYYKVVDEELEDILPNTLNLGSRFAEWGTSIEVQKACAKYADIVSFNVYKDDINKDWIYTKEIDKPCIVGEFHFGSTDRGMFSGGLISAINQQDRADKYENYMKQVANNDYFVGAHWFQYMDQPLTGRAWDGENYNCGFIDGTDVPYKELVMGAKNIHSQMYDIRFNKVEVESIDISENEMVLTKDNNIVSLAATISPLEAIFKEVEWTSSNSRAAVVSEEGVVTGVSNGETVIRATSKDNTSVYAECKVTVNGFDDIICDFEDIIFTDKTSLDQVADIVQIDTSKIKTSFSSQNGLEIQTEYESDWGSSADNFSYGVTIDRTKPWVLGVEPTLKIKVSNPCNEKITIGVNIQETKPEDGTNAAVVSKYYEVPVNSSYTIEVLPEEWPDTLAIDSIDFIKLYILEKKIPANSDVIVNNRFAIESIIVEDETKR